MAGLSTVRQIFNEFFFCVHHPSFGARLDQIKEGGKKKDSNVAGRWAGPGKRTKGSGIEGWKIRRRRVVNYPKKNTTKYHVARGRKLRAFFLIHGKVDEEQKKDREKKER